MSHIIYKYSLPQPGDIIKLPAHIKPRHIAMQDNIPCLWAEVDTENKSEDRMAIYCVGTGWPFPETLEYLGTVQVGPFVWHYVKLPPGAVEPW